jgi:PRTRC genetic system ThiF family protein
MLCRRGGTGSAILGALPFLSQALVARGHPGLFVRVMDADRISESNCVRQPFSQHEIGLHKATVLVNRLNAFFGSAWDAVCAPFTATTDIADVDLIIGCVDTRAARAAIAAACAVPRSRLSDGGPIGPTLWLDCGNGKDFGQVVLGELWSPKGRGPLPTISERHPDMIDATLDASDDTPSCSALEALTRQAPGVNALIAHTALGLLGRLLWDGAITHHGAYISLASGATTPISVPSACIARLPSATKRKPPKSKKPARRRPRTARTARTAQTRRTATVP